MRHRDVIMIGTEPLAFQLDIIVPSMALTH